MMPTGITFQEFITFLKAIGDENRLQLLAALSKNEMTVEEVATFFNLPQPQASRNLARLKDAGLVTVRADHRKRYYAADVRAMQRSCRRLAAPDTLEAIAKMAEATAFRKRTTGQFIVQGRLIAIPERTRQREIIFSWVMEPFAFGRLYFESDVNAILQRVYADPPALVHELILCGYLGQHEGRYYKIDMDFLNHAQ